MATASVALVVALLAITAHFSFSSTVPAFLWSPHLSGMKKVVEYRTLSPRELARSAMTNGKWSKYLCPGEDGEQSKNFAFLFVGTEMQSMDISKSTKTDPALVDLLKDSFSNSNFSLAYPYISAEDERVAIESSMISEFAHTCKHRLGINRIATVGLCSIEGENFEKLKDVHSIHDYMNSRIEKVSDGGTDLIVLCRGSDTDEMHSDGSILSQLLNFVNQLGAKYTVLYVSDPVRSMKQVPNRGLERFLGEGIEASNSTCDEVCQTKASLLEGILVGVVLLVILISGLCCMMGIDTPTRFETPQDS